MSTIELSDFKIRNRSSPPSERDRMRMLRFIETKSTCENYLKNVLIKVRLGISDHLNWIGEFYTIAWEHEKFMEFISLKLSVYPSHERLFHVEEIIDSLNRDEVAVFCYNVTSDTLSVARENFEETVVEQEVEIDTNEDRITVCDFGEDVKVVVYETEDQLNAMSYEGQNFENFTKVSEKDANVIRNNAVVADNIDEINISYNRISMINNDVYNLSHQYLSKGVTFGSVLYAPPGSGKTTFNRKKKAFIDTDWMYLWPYMCKSRHVITNMPHLIGKGFSVAVIPSRKVFSARCSRIPGFSDTWYDGLVKDCQLATIVILSDKYLSNINIIKRIFPSS